MTHASVCVRQSVLFSATFPPAVERLVRSAVLDPIYIRVGGGMNSISFNLLIYSLLYLKWNVLIRFNYRKYSRPNN